MTGNDVMGIGSHVFLGGETAEQLEKWIVGSWNRKSRVFRRGKPLTSGKKDRGLIQPEVT